MKRVLSASLVILSAFICVSNSYAKEKAEESVSYTSFNPAEILLDNNGVHLNAHGAGVLFDKGKYYMVGEHKVAGSLGNKAMVGVHCYSSTDLYNWTDEGIILEMSQEPNSPIIVGTILERPKIIFNEKTNKYVMFMHIESRKGETAKSPKLEDIINEKPNYLSAKVGIAISDKITGPFEFVRMLRPQAGVYPINEKENLIALEKELNEKDANWKQNYLQKNSAKLKSNLDKNLIGKGLYFLRDFKEGQMARDMTLFIDDDGKAYYACSSEENSTLHIHELTDDYQDFSGNFVRVLHKQFHEAPAFFKRNGKYYMFSSHCTGWRPNAGRVSSCDKMLGDWKELGNPCRGTKEEMATTFKSQSTAIIKVEGLDDAFIYLGDRWTPDNAIDGRYLFLPVEWEGEMPIIKWYKTWDLSKFTK
ncbi:MAG: glycoside hydrolase family 43 protein [Opitutales bacterium]